MDFTRRTVLHGLAASSATLLLRAIFPGHAAAVETGPPSLELTVNAVSDQILRITVAAAEEPLDRMYDDGSIIVKPQTSIMRVLETGQESTTFWNGRSIHLSSNPLRLRIEKSDGAIPDIIIETTPSRIIFSCGNGPLYGLGQGAHSLDRRGTTDAMRSGQLDEDLRTYGAHVPIPWLMSPEGWGLFFHEPWGSFDLTGNPGIFKPEETARGIDLFLLLGETPAELMKQWAELTGYPHLPPLWALGYQQSHRTLSNREDLIAEARTFRDKRLPCDALIYLGTGFCPSGWNTGHGSFEFNKSVFPDPPKVIDELHGLDFKVVLHVVNPPINLHGSVTDTAPAADDPTDASAYWKWHVPLDEIGVDGWWPDEGDPLPKAARLVRNRMYFEGDRSVRPNVRPYALHRNGYAGMQRYAWLWSGDVNSTWRTLAEQVMQGISTGLSGIPFWGTDTGGFVPTKDFTADLFLRWFQFSAFCPLFRSHGVTWKLRLPWGWNTGDYSPAELSPQAAATVLPKPAELHNAAVEPICRKYLELRYRMLPYIYSAVEETHSTGLPIIRSLGLHFPADPRALACEDQYLFGPSLLIAPVVEQAARERAVYLPEGVWWDCWTNRQYKGPQTIKRPVDLETIPFYVRAGAVIPTGPVKQWTSAPSTDPLTLTVYPGADGASSLYEDDGISYACEHGDYTRTTMLWNDRTHTLTLRASRPGIERRFKVALAGSAAKEIVFTGRDTDFKL
ncbi:Alpha-glucosidase [Acidisarcina polymorpha]|uniref:Alpha-glucosidase n=1 Tax=Acidisarcina polymorpha TaxID=2211140 RepID=A0A2Z5FTW4_9BACT|nr:TIM-barrel domain-containing protein [Acidisarcina polymorpha]AXC10263.1 Alpha-glucosidase [Acidisarcina polymorpha]